MAEFTPVLPAALYPLIDTNDSGAWHFVHAPQVVGQMGSSEALLKCLGRYRCTVILDCFAFELAGLLPCIRDVYEAATVLQDTCADLVIVCPDTIKDGDMSFELLKQHGPALNGYGRLMVVPHGQDLYEWMTWAEKCIDFCQNMGIGSPIVGLPRYMSDWGLSARYKAANWLHHYYKARVHLLGAGRGLTEVLHAAGAPSVMSCDSTAPFAYIMEHGVVTTHLAHADMKVEMDPEWWDLRAFDIPHNKLLAMQVNVALWKEALRSVTYAEPYSIM